MATFGTLGGARNTAEGPVALIVEFAIGQLEFVDIVPDVGFGEVQDGMNPGVGRIFPGREGLFQGSGPLLIPADGGDEAANLILDDRRIEGVNLQGAAAGLLIDARRGNDSCLRGFQDDQVEVPEGGDAVAKFQGFGKLQAGVDAEDREGHRLAAQGTDEMQDHQGILAAGEGGGQGAPKIFQGVI